MESNSWLTWLRVIGEGLLSGPCSNQLTKKRKFVQFVDILSLKNKNCISGISGITTLVLIIQLLKNSPIIQMEKLQKIKKIHFWNNWCTYYQVVAPQSLTGFHDIKLL